MKNRYKNINIVLIFTLIGMFLFSDISYALRVPLNSVSLDRMRTLESMTGMEVGINGTGGLTGPHLLLWLLLKGAFVKASYFPKIVIPTELKEDEFRAFRENLTATERNILIPEDNRADLKYVRVFLHVAGVPIHYADSRLASRIFAVDAIGSALVALAAHDENKNRAVNGKGPLRMIMFSSISSVWMDDYISMLENEPKTPQEREIGVNLRKWLKDATEKFIEYSRGYYKGETTTDPETFVRSYLHEPEGLINMVGGLKRFDYYALSKLLMDKMLKALADEKILENTIVIRPGSMLGTGLLKKEDMAFIPKMVTMLLIGEKEEIYKGRVGYYLPFSTLTAILEDLILTSGEEKNKEIEFINLTGKEIPQEEFYRDYIKPAVAEYLGIEINSADYKELGKNITTDENPFPTDKTRYVTKQETHPVAIKHKVTEELLHKVVREIVKEIIDRLRSGPSIKISELVRRAL